MDSPKRWFSDAAFERDRDGRLWISSTTGAIEGYRVVRVGVEERDDALVCTGFHVVADDELTARAIVRVPFGAIRDAALDWAVHMTALPPAPKVTAGRRGGGQRRLSLRFLAEVAELYLYAADTHPAAPVKWMAETQTIGGIRQPHEVPTVRSWIVKAKRAGLLAGTVPGKAGGELTHQARAILDAPDEEQGR